MAIAANVLAHPVLEVRVRMDDQHLAVPVLGDLDALVDFLLAGVRDERELGADAEGARELDGYPVVVAEPRARLDADDGGEDA